MLNKFEVIKTALKNIATVQEVVHEGVLTNHAKSFLIQYQNTSIARHVAKNTQYSIYGFIRTTKKDNSELERFFLESYNSLAENLELPEIGIDVSFDATMLYELGIDVPLIYPYRGFKLQLNMNDNTHLTNEFKKLKG